MNLNVGLDYWIILDGNYPDFVAGEDYAFALEVCPSSISRSSVRDRSLRPLRGAQYQYLGEAVFSSLDLTILDVGVRCYHEGAVSAPLSVGEFAAGELYLGVDPFFWKDSLSRRPGMPSLTYRWQVTGISVETTPWILSHDSRGREIWRHDDRVAPSFLPVVRTGEGPDDQKSWHFVLSCELIGDL